jgi:dienelactone hydrolase
VTKAILKIFQLLALLLPVLGQPAYAVGGGDASKAPAAALAHERVVMVPSADPDVLLQTTVFMPEGKGPFPLAIMNHGANGDMPPSQQPRYRWTFSAYYFLSRGYAVALPMMRGYAGSGGMLKDSLCDDVGIGLEAANDIRAVIGYMKQQPDIDGSRIVVAGQSFGGWNTLALGTLDVPGVKGLMSFAGGMKAESCTDPDSALLTAAGILGGKTKTPSIWFFGDNDHVLNPSLWHAMYDRYVAAGGSAELVAYGTFGPDSHQLLSYPEALALWVPKADAFLARVGLPDKEVSPEYLPMRVPPPSHYADLNDTQALPYLGEQGAAYYREFLDKPMPRALAIGPNGAGSSTGGFDPLAQALKLCGEHGPGCRLYAVDDTVVWVRPTPAPKPTHFAALADVAAVPRLNTAGRSAYAQFLHMPLPRAFALAPDGSAVASSLGADPVAYALEHCRQLYHRCQLYAVDSEVVWPNKQAN